MIIYKKFKFNNKNYKNASKLLSVFIINLIFFNFHSFAFNKDPNNILNNKIKNILKKDKIKYQLPALSVGIKLPGNNIKTYTFRDNSSSKSVKINSNSLFQIGSITKTFTASIIFQLSDKNMLNIHQKITQWLPQYSRWENITIENLLRHTSGVYDYTHGKSFDNMLRNNSNKNFSLSELANIAYGQMDFSKPNKKYHYTNTDYILLGMIIEKSTHKTLSQIFNQYLHDYQLNHSFYAPNGYSDKIKSRLVHGYNRDGTFKFNQDVTSINLTFWQSAGAMISTPNDLILWLEQLFSGKIISEKSLNEMMSVKSEADNKPLSIQNINFSDRQDNSLLTEIGSGAGMGLVYFNHHDLAWVHAGGTPGYESFYVYIPKKMIYIALMYNIKPKEQLIFAKIANDILDVLKD